MKDNKLWTKDDKEIAQLDERLFIIKAEKNSAESPYLEGENGQVVSDSECSESSDEPIAYPAALEKAEPNIELWHRRLGHLSLDSIRKTKEMVKGLDFKKKESPPLVTRICEPCEKGRPIRKVRKSTNHIALHALDEIHIDVVMLTPRSFPGGYRYGLICTDGASTAKWIWTFAKKGDAFNALKKHVRFCKTQYGRTIKRYRLDDGREYTIIQLDELAGELGQLVERTTPYMPEQDGKSERSIRTIMERARCNTIDQDIPIFLWDEIARGIVHISNRVSISSLNGKIPY